MSFIKVIKVFVFKYLIPDWIYEKNLWGTGLNKDDIIKGLEEGVEK
jgi:hypothetical protein